MSAWPPQATLVIYSCGNFSGTSSLECRRTKGSIGHTTLSWTVFMLKMKIKGTFTPLFYWRI
ncbi:predicted protein, partial [Trichoderma reesei QM6a]